MKGGAVYPVRIRFTKRGRVRFVSHRDVARAFDRALRIAALPLAYTEGFSPRPKVSFGLALSLGFESDAEYLDVEFREPVDLDALAALLSPALPEGIDVIGTRLLAERARALQESVTHVQWRVEFDDVLDPTVLAEAVTNAQEAASLPVERTRKGRTTVDDARPALARLAAVDRWIEVELCQHPVTIRPDELMTALGLAEHVRLIVRTGQIIQRDGARLEPLDADAHHASDTEAAARAPEVLAS